MISFTFEFSKKSLDLIVKDLEKYNKNLIIARKKVLIRLAEYTQERVKHYISTTTGLTGYTVTGKLLSSIMISPIVENSIKVYTNLAYAKYVEFGTGIIGSKNPHPEAKEKGWKYGEKGWIYADKTGEFWHTLGQVSHGFMNKALKDLEDNYLDIAREVFKEEGII